MIGFREQWKFYIVIPIIILLIIALLPTGYISGQARPTQEVQQKLEGISQNEKIVLEDLFDLLQRIEDMDREQIDITQEIETLKDEIEVLRKEIENQQREYESGLNVLKQFLRSYQRRGPTSYLNIILSSKDLASFLRSINIIKDLTGNVGELLHTLEQKKEQLLNEQKKLSINIADAETKRERLEDAIDKNLRLREEQESYLASLREEEAKYRDLLVNLQEMWDEIKALLPRIAKEFSRIIGENKFPAEDLNLRYGLLNMVGVIHEDTLNDVYRENSDLTEMIFHFHPEKVVLEIPEKQIVLRGMFSIAGGTALKFKAKEGSFYGMPLEPSSIDELFRDEYLSIDFGRFIQGVTLQRINLYDGYLEFTIKPNF